MSCKISIIKLIAIAAVMLSGCTNDSDVLPEGEGGTMTFQLSTRAGNGIGKGQQVRLFVAERAQEHSGYPVLPGNTNMDQFHPTVPDDAEDPYDIYRQPEEDLQVVETIDLGGSSYQVTGLYGQWYKFAFVCTPKVGGELFGPETEPNKEPNHDFGECYIDYAPVLDYQEDNLNTAQDEDLAIYRKVIDRWADASSPLTEDVTLTRQTGELVLNMGIPEDQFDGEVDHFVITLQTPTQMYVRDMARDSVLIAAGPSEYKKFTWNVISQSEEQEIHISLLPDVKPGFDSETLAEGDDEGETPAVTDERRLYYLAVQAFDANDGIVYIKGLEGTTPKESSVIQDISKNIDRNILIRKNIRTTVLFNGMTTGQFEVRYAGFDDNAAIDVDDDAWDGEN